jgi:hypothetical protein
MNSGTYICPNGHTFSRLTNIDMPQMIPCAHCESFMKLVEEDYYYGPLDKFVKKANRLIKGNQ